MPTQGRVHDVEEVLMANGVREFGTKDQFFVVSVLMSGELDEEKQMIIRTSMPPHEEEFVLRVPALQLMKVLVDLDELPFEGEFLNSTMEDSMATWCLQNVNLVVEKEEEGPRLVLNGLEQDVRERLGLGSIFEYDRALKDRQRHGLTFEQRRDLQRRYEEMEAVREKCMLQAEEERKRRLAEEVERQKAELAEEERQRQKRIQEQKDRREAERQELAARERALLAEMKAKAERREKSILALEKDRCERGSQEILARKQEFQEEEKARQEALEKSRRELAKRKELQQQAEEERRRKQAELDAKRRLGFQAEEQRIREAHELYVTKIKLNQAEKQQADADAKAAKEEALEAVKAARAAAWRERVATARHFEHMEDQRAWKSSQRQRERNQAESQHIMELKAAKAEERRIFAEKVAAEKQRREQEHREQLLRERELQEEREHLEELRDKKAKETMDTRVARDVATAKYVEEYVTMQRNAEVQRRRVAEEEREAKLQALKEEYEKKIKEAERNQNFELMRETSCQLRQKERDAEELRRKLEYEASQAQEHEKKVQELSEKERMRKEEQEWRLRQAEERQARTELLERKRAQRIADRENARAERERLRQEAYEQKLQATKA